MSVLHDAVLGGVMKLVRARGQRKFGRGLVWGFDRIELLIVWW